MNFVIECVFLMTEIVTSLWQKFVNFDKLVFTFGYVLFQIDFSSKNYLAPLTTVSFHFFFSDEFETLTNFNEKMVKAMIFQRGKYEINSKAH